MGNGVANASVRGWFFLQHGGKAVLNSLRATHTIEERNTMKIRLMSLAIAGIALALTSYSRASVSILDPDYSFSAYHAHPDAGSEISSFAWDSGGSLYYQVSTSWSFGGLFKWDGATLGTLVSADFSLFTGASVISVGDNIYYNTSDFSNTQNVMKYGPLSGAASSSLVSTSPNWGIYSRGAGEMFMTGAVGFGTNEIFYGTLDGTGNFVSSPFSLGETIGASGPIAFDLAGNMYYAPGYGDLNIYKYTAADVAAAIADPANTPLPPAESRLWYNYSADFANVGGGTGMAVDDAGNLLVTLTDFTNPSYLVQFDVDEFGEFDKLDAILESTGRLGDVRFHDGAIYLGSDNEILKIDAVPEPGTFGLLVMGGVAILAFAWSRRRRDHSLHA